VTPWKGWTQSSRSRQRVVACLGPTSNSCVMRHQACPAAASDDDVAHAIGRQLGPSGGVGGTVPASVNDRPAKPDAESPAIEWRAVWPQLLDWKHLATASVAFVGVVAGFFLVWTAGSGVAIVGFVGVGVMSLCLLWLVLRLAGFRWIRPSSRLKPCTSARFGPGIRIGPETLALRVLVIALVGCAIYYVAVALAFWLRLESLLPEFRDSSTHKWLAVIFAVVLAAIALLLSIFRPSTGLEIYQDVVIRTVGQWRLLRIGDDVTLPWASIVEIVDEVRLNHSGLWTTREPLIRLVTSEPLPSTGRLGWDTDEYLQLPASWMAAEPNLMLAVLRAMLESDERRQEILSHDPAVVFAPPPLRERFRVSDVCAL